MRRGNGVQEAAIKVFYLPRLIVQRSSVQPWYRCDTNSDTRNYHKPVELPGKSRQYSCGWQRGPCFTFISTHYYANFIHLSNYGSNRDNQINLNPNLANSAERRWLYFDDRHKFQISSRPCVNSLNCLESYQVYCYWYFSASIVRPRDWNRVEAENLFTLSTNYHEVESIF